MLESGKSTLTEDLHSVIDQALRSGMDAEAIARMVAERVRAHRVSDANDIVGVLEAPETPPEDAGDVIYEPGDLPEGLIDLPSAAEVYGYQVGTLRTWVQRGFLKQRGRMKGAAPKGYVVVDVCELEARIAAPRKKGRPRKKMR